MQITDRISATLKDKLTQNGASACEVETRAGYSHSDTNSQAEATLEFIIKSPLVETDPSAFEKQFLAALSQIEALKPYVTTESETHHMKRLATDLEGFIKTEAELNAKNTGEKFATIPHEYVKWFEELSKRNEYSIKHALNVSKTNIGVIEIKISTPKDVDPEVIVKNFEARKDAIMEMLADRVVKYAEGLDTPEKKAALKEQVKKLNVTFAASSNEWGKSVEIQIMSDAQRDFLKNPGSAPPKDPGAFVDTNPLMKLQDGDDDKDKGPSKPQPHLKKALARAFLFAGDKANEIFPLIAGKEDMRRAVIKSLVGLKNKQSGNVELGKKIDAFIADDVFKNPNEWNMPVEKREVKKSSPCFIKRTAYADGKLYEKGVMNVTFNLPADKFPQIQEALAASHTDKSCHMAKVDSIEPVAVVSGHQEVHDATKHLIGKAGKPDEVGDKLLAALSSAQEKVNKRIETNLESVNVGEQDLETYHNFQRDFAAAMAQIPTPVMSPSSIRSSSPGVAMAI